MAVHAFKFTFFLGWTRKLSARFARASTFLAPAESFLTTSDDSPWSMRNKKHIINTHRMCIVFVSNLLSAPS